MSPNCTTADFPLINTTCPVTSCPAILTKSPSLIPSCTGETPPSRFGFTLSFKPSRFCLTLLVSFFSALFSLMCRMVFSISLLVCLMSNAASSLALLMISFFRASRSWYSLLYFSNTSWYRASFSLACPSRLTNSSCSSFTFFISASSPVRSLPMIPSASLTIPPKPVLRAISNAKELPGFPMSSTNNGSSFLLSNCMEAFLIPSF